MQSSWRWPIDSPCPRSPSTRVVALRQALDEVVCATNFAAAATRLRVLVGDAERDVVEHRAGEQLDVLRHAADLGAQLRRREMRHVGAVEQHAPGGRPVETLDQVGERRLARTRRADDAQDLARLDRQGRHPAGCPACSARRASRRPPG
jgi:hypothetical protein